MFSVEMALNSSDLPLPPTLQVPEYARTRAINLHPLVTHPFIRVPEHPTNDDRHMPVLSFVQKYMVRTMDFIRCSDVCTDWEVRYAPMVSQSTVGVRNHMDHRVGGSRFLELPAEAFLRGRLCFQN